MTFSTSSPLFQFYISTIKTNAVTHPKVGDWACFNSILVRLKHNDYLMQMYNQSFNSILVRLKQAEHLTPRWKLFSFNSILVRLKPGLSYSDAQAFDMFQFYISTIKTCRRPERGSRAW